MSSTKKIHKNLKKEEVAVLFFDKKGNVLEGSELINENTNITEEERKAHSEHFCVYKNTDLETVAYLRFSGDDMNIHPDSFLKTIAAQRSE